jgi:hypothetical protein
MLLLTEPGTDTRITDVFDGKLPNRDIPVAAAEESMIEPNMKLDRRRGLRITQTRPIKLFEPAAGRYFGGETLDVSTTGLRVTLPGHSPLRAGRLVNIHVGLSDHGLSLANRRQMMPARVVWVSRPRGRKDKTISAGIEFLSSIAAHLDAA